MGKRQVRFSGEALRGQLAQLQGRHAQLQLQTGGTMRVKVLAVKGETLEVNDFTNTQKQIPFAQIVEVVIDQEAPF